MGKSAWEGGGGQSEKERRGREIPEPLKLYHRTNKLIKKQNNEEFKHKKNSSCSILFLYQTSGFLFQPVSVYHKI